MQIENNAYSKEELRNYLTELVVSRGLAMPAIFTLEMYKPLQSLFLNSTHLSAPLMIPLFGLKNYKLLLGVLESKNEIELLIQSIEFKLKRVEQA